MTVTSGILVGRPESKRSLAMEKMKSKIFCDIKFPIISLFKNPLQEGFKSPCKGIFVGYLLPLKRAITSDTYWRPANTKVPTDMNLLNVTIFTP